MAWTNPVQVTTANVSGIDFNASRATYSIGGKVTSGGAGLPNVTVTAGPYSAVTNGTGDYLIGGVPNGTYALAAQLAGRTFKEQGFTNPVQVSGAEPHREELLRAGLQRLGRGDRRRRAAHHHRRRPLGHHRALGRQVALHPGQGAAGELEPGGHRAGPDPHSGRSPTRSPSPPPRSPARTSPPPPAPATWCRASSRREASRSTAWWWTAAPRAPPPTPWATTRSRASSTAPTPSPPTSRATSSRPASRSATVAGADSTGNDFGVLNANSPPTVMIPARASANPVTGTTVTLEVLGDDDDSEANLTYTWKTLFATAPVTYQRNASNGAKTTQVTFTKAGAYAFEVDHRRPGRLEGEEPGDGAGVAGAHRGGGHARPRSRSSWARSGSSSPPWWTSSAISSTTASCRSGRSAAGARSRRWGASPPPPREGPSP